MYNTWNTCTIFPMHIQLCNTCTICLIHVQYVQYTYNMCNTFTIFAIHVHYVQYIYKIFAKYMYNIICNIFTIYICNTCLLCTIHVHYVQPMNTIDHIYLIMHTGIIRYTQTVNKLIKTLQYLQTFYESVQNRTYCLLMSQV